jgi:hypothetical protein
MFARDAADEVITTLGHDPIRVMWMGAFDQRMADTFVTKHSEWHAPGPAAAALPSRVASCVCRLLPAPVRFSQMRA